MADALWRFAALLSCVCGMGLLALALKPHWRQVRGTQPLTRTTLRVLRVTGTAGLLASLGLDLRVDHPSMAALVWVMALAPSALCVAFVLAWRPGWLGWLVLWVRPTPSNDPSTQTGRAFNSMPGGRS